MTSHLYAVADAAGNIYPGTFAKLARTAMIEHANPGAFFAETLDGSPMPCYGEPAKEWRLKPAIWVPFAECGDHVVYCRIETNEDIKVTIEP